MKLHIYLDTSVFSVLLDERTPDRQQATREFWGRLSEFEACSSSLARDELQRTQDPTRRTELLELLDGLRLHPVTAEMQDLAAAYVDAGIFTPLMLDDATHVAAAVLTRQDVLLSWNFKHLVNRRRRAMINEVNVLRGLQTIEIVAPPEL
ncbi:MAG TPA: PIN domain-containing protein [Planctomycetota bacterium]